MNYSFSFSKEAWKYNSSKLVNQVFKLLPMFEKGEDWKYQLDSIMRTLKGYNNIFANNPHFMGLVTKLSFLDSIEDKSVFRKVIFEAITELKQIEVGKDESPNNEPEN